MTSERQQDDLDLWREWQRTNDQAHLNKLMTRLNPLIQREVGKWGGSVPLPALESKARVLTIKALKSYSPNKGAAIGTHVASQIRKLSRSVYPYQNVARLPENKQLYYNTFQVANNTLLDNLGREPTAEEMADELGWTPKKVRDFHQSFNRRELVESEGGLMEGHEDRSSLVDFYYHGLSPDDKLMFEDITGYSGKKVLDNTKLMKKYKITQGQLSYRKQKFVQDIERIQHGGI